MALGEADNRDKIRGGDRGIKREHRDRSRSPSRGRRDDRGGARDSRWGGRVGEDRGRDVSDRMVYISNIPYEVRWMELKDLIREKAGDVSFVEVLENAQGKSKGAAVVEFRDQAGLNKCIENMNGLTMKDRNLVVKPITNPPAFFARIREETGIDFLSRSGGSSRPAGGRGGGMGPADVRGPGGRDGPRGGFGGGRDMGPPGGRPFDEPNFETFGLSMSFLRSLGIDGPLTNRVFIANLPYNVQTGKLCDIFSLAGTITWVDLHMDKDGKSKGMCVIEFSHPIEAVQAISMLNNQRLADRNINVKMDRFDKEKRGDHRPGELPDGLRGVGMGLGANGAPLSNIAQLLANQRGGGDVGAGDFRSGGAAVSAMNESPFSGPMPIPQQQVALPQAQSAFASQAVNALMQSAVQQNQQPFAQANNQGLGRPNPGLDMFSQAAAITPGMYTGNAMPNQQPQLQAPQMSGAPSASLFDSLNPMASGRGPNPMTSSFNPGVQSMGPAQPRGPAAAGHPSDYELPAQPSSRTILIRNLPMDYTWHMVRDRLSKYGEIDFAEMVQPGCARIRFKNVYEAERVRAALHQTIVEGRSITVSFDVGY